MSKIHEQYDELLQENAKLTKELKTTKSSHSELFRIGKIYRECIKEALTDADNYMGALREETIIKLQNAINENYRIG